MAIGHQLAQDLSSLTRQASSVVIGTGERDWLASSNWGMLPYMAGTSDPIPSALFDDLDIDRDEDDEEWERRLMQLAGQRVQAARVRLEHLGVVDADGKLVFVELPSDMRPDSDTTLETG